MDFRLTSQSHHHRMTSFKKELPKLTPRKKNLSLDLLSEVRNYQKQKNAIESGQLTSRGLMQVLKPNKLKWVSYEMKLNSDSMLKNKLTAADFFLNSKKKNIPEIPQSLMQFISRLKPHIQIRRK